MIPTAAGFVTLFYHYYSCSASFLLLFFYTVKLVSGAFLSWTLGYSPTRTTLTCPYSLAEKGAVNCRLLVSCCSQPGVCPHPPLPQPLHPQLFSQEPSHQAQSQHWREHPVQRPHRNLLRSTMWTSISRRQRQCSAGRSQA